MRPVVLQQKHQPHPNFSLTKNFILSKHLLPKIQNLRLESPILEFKGKIKMYFFCRKFVCGKMQILDPTFFSSRR